MTKTTVKKQINSKTKDLEFSVKLQKYTLRLSYKENLTI